MSANLFGFSLKRNSRSKSIKITVVSGGEVFVSAPERLSEEVILNFVRANQKWIDKKVEIYKKFPKKYLNKKEEKRIYEHFKMEALQLAKVKVENLNRHYGFQFNKILIKNSKTRWGSCSSKGTITFNYKILFLPPHISDYLVIHELCHLKERNHGPHFWNLVSKMCPEYKKVRVELKNFDRTFRPDLLGV